MGPRSIPLRRPVPWFLLASIHLLSSCGSQEPRELPPGSLAPWMFADRRELPELIPRSIEPPNPPAFPPPEAGAERQAAERIPAPAPEPQKESVPEEGRRARTIDLAAALEIGSKLSLRVAVAREQLAEARSRLDLAEARWLPDLWAGVGYSKHEGALQETAGDILQVSRNSGAASGGLVASFDFAGALLEPRAEQHRVNASIAEVASSTNNILLEIGLGYNALLEAQSRLSFAEADVLLAEELVELAEAFADSGQGLEADAARARSELEHRRSLVAAAQQALAARSARLATLLRMDPAVPLRAEEPRIAPFALLPADLELDALIARALASRPEVQALRSAVEAEEAREREENLRLLLPRLQVGVRGGGLGGGPGSDWGGLRDEGDLTLAVVWEMRNAGLGESASRRQQAARTRRARLELQIARDTVAEQVAVAFLQARNSRRQVELAARSVEESLRSLDLNMRRIRGAEGLPIEALQAIQAAAAARESYLTAVGDWNRSQFLLLHAVAGTVKP